MDDPEIRISDYIDDLNAEQQPDAHRGSDYFDEMNKLFGVARLVRSLKEPTLPNLGYPQRLVKEVMERLAAPKSSARPRRVIGTMAAIAAGLIIEITPPDGLVYYLWVDQETNLPVQLQTPMQNSLQSTYTFENFQPNIGIDSDKFAYHVPAGYKVVEENPGQLVDSVGEAENISGLNLLLPEVAPNRILAFKDRVVMDYGDTTITEGSPQNPRELTPNAALGKAANGPLEIWGERLRWQQNSLEIQIEGPQRLVLAGQITPDIVIPDAGADLTTQAQVTVPVNMEIVQNSQLQVDRGSSPWQLDPVQVASTFANLQVSPKGIEGEPILPIVNFKITANNGRESLVEVSQGPFSNIYLKRLIRQDESGIWTVVGYDPR